MTTTQPAASLFDAKPDYEHCASMARWDIEWLPALLLDRDPTVVTHESVQSDDCPRELREKYLKIEAIIRNHKEAGRFAWPVEPADFLSWAVSNRFECSNGLISALRTRGIEIADWRLECERLKTENAAVRAMCERQRAELAEQYKAEAEPDKEMTVSERRSARTIIITMAVKGYGYRIDDEKSPVANTIEDQASELGLKVDDGTVRSWLRKSTRGLPSAAREQLRRPNSAKR